MSRRGRRQEELRLAVRKGKAGATSRMGDDAAVHHAANSLAPRSELKRAKAHLLDRGFLSRRQMCAALQ